MTVEEQWLTTDSYRATGSLQELSMLVRDTRVRPLKMFLESSTSSELTLWDASWAYRYVENDRVKWAFANLRSRGSATDTTPLYELSLRIMTEPDSPLKS